MRNGAQNIEGLFEIEKDGSYVPPTLQQLQPVMSTFNRAVVVDFPHWKSNCES